MKKEVLEIVKLIEKETELEMIDHYICELIEILIKYRRTSYKILYFINISINSHI